MKKLSFDKVLLFIAFIFFEGCTPQKPINLSVVKRRVARYYECGQYDKDLTKIVADAVEYFSSFDPTDDMVVIFDIDDTVLSDYANEKSISFGYIPKLYHEWILQANAPAISQVKKLYDFLVARGFHIIFLTGRKYNEYDATVKNLIREGYSTYDRIIVRQPNELDMTAQAYKSAHRKELIEEGFDIVGSIGDQWSDLHGGYAGHTIKLPNYRYELP